MNREIKFKAWDGKKMHYNAIVGNGQVLYIPDAVGGYRWHNFVEVTPLESSGQNYPGTTEPIFEADVVLHGERKMIVEKRDSRWLLVSLDKKTGILLSFSHPKKLGNIYENPELLNHVQ